MRRTIPALLAGGMTNRRTLRTTLAIALLAGLPVITLTSPASGVVSGQETVSVTSARDGSNVKSVTASCPPGKRVIGAGTEFEPGGAVVLQGMLASPGSVVATAAESRQQPIWSMKSHAFCADRPAGYQIVSATSPTNGSSPKSITASCPPGRRVIGTGAEISGGDGRVALDELRPRTDTVTATADNLGDFDQPWSVTAQAICATPLTGLEIVTAVSDLGSAPTRLAQANCPTGKRRLGSGFDISGGNGEVGPLQLLPVQVGILATAIEHRDFDGDWTVRAFAICGGLNLQTVEVRSLTDSTSPKSAMAACRPGKQLVGTGFHLGGQVPGFAMAEGVIPSPSGVTVTGSERQSTTGKLVSGREGDVRQPSARTRDRRLDESYELGDVEVRDRNVPGRKAGRRHGGRGRGWWRGSRARRRGSLAHRRRRSCARGR